MKRSSFQENWLFGEVNKEKKQICIPHDAMLEQGRCSDSESGSGGAYFCGGIYEYEKIFFVPEEWRDMDAIIEFEGIYPSAIITLNNVEIGKCNYGYTGIRLPLEHLIYGAENKINVHVDNHLVPNSRWYSGAGIYRPVWLWLGKKMHIQPEGIQITTITHDPAQILVEVSHTGRKLLDTNNENLLIEILFKDIIVAQGYGEKVTLLVPDAKLWSHNEPWLYQCRVSLKDGDMVLDTENIQFGIRKIEWSNQGLFINGKSVLLQGGCIHHDNGILGARNFEKSEWRRIKRLKDHGFNAIRSAHNPVSNATLEACDALGMYVMDETWDMWYQTKNTYDYGNSFETHYKEDVRAMVKKDFNHPSVIMYSIGNEVSEPTEEKGVALGKELVEMVHELDGTRPVTAGINITLLLMSLMMKGDTSVVPEGEHKTEMNEKLEIPGVDKMDSTSYNQMIAAMGTRMNMAAASEKADEVSSPILNLLDIAGYNYASSRYEMESKVHPNRIVVGSETFPYDLVSNWSMVKKHPYLIGDFMWTAWDYLGEAGIGTWTYEEDAKCSQKKYPWLLADTGAIDILGNDNAQAGLASVVWGKRNVPYIGVVPVNKDREKLIKSVWRGSNAIPYWSYQGCDGFMADVEVYSDAYEIELYVNDKSQGKKKLEALKAVFQITYESGTLKAVAYDETGTIQSESSLCSADGNTQIRICPEEDLPQKGDILYLDILIAGENGEIECNRDTCLNIQVQGGELLGFGSANPRTEESYLDGKFTTYYGRSQAVVKCMEDQLTVNVSGEGLSAAELKLNRRG